MSNTTNFAALLDRRADEIEKPKPLPIGTYSFVVGNHDFGESAQKKTPYVQFEVSPRAALEDVDESLLAEVANWQDRKMRLTYYLTDDALFRLTEFFEHCGLDIAGQSLAELIPQAQGTMVNAYVKQQARENDPDDFYAFIDVTTPAE